MYNRLCGGIVNVVRKFLSTGLLTTFTQTEQAICVQWFAVFSAVSHKGNFPVHQLKHKLDRSQILTRVAPLYKHLLQAENIKYNIATVLHSYSPPQVSLEVMATDFILTMQLQHLDTLYI